ncbi:hypothetical protein Pmani_019078 [Petrolisthes manimaculis]|uniref:Uncharacterized protein n=1 Tax=Petrolisthes manimaculis TaxID=1843537 RepID=A0AAE1U7T0_9EUCA|nr:hypothetical protein Pmani_019078 [Petrolisthes manimaculis]
MQAASSGIRHKARHPPAHARHTHWLARGTVKGTNRSAPNTVMGTNCAAPTTVKGLNCMARYVPHQLHMSFPSHNHYDQMTSRSGALTNSTSMYVLTVQYQQAVYPVQKPRITRSWDG